MSTPFSEILRIEKKTTSKLFADSSIIEVVTLHESDAFSSFLDMEDVYRVLKNAYKPYQNSLSLGSVIKREDVEKLRELLENEKHQMFLDFESFDDEGEGN